MFERARRLCRNTQLRQVSRVPLQAACARRMQSSSSKTASTVAKKIIIEKEDNSSDNNGIKQKKGFSSVNKVPSTVELKPRDLLLDNLFQGYRPLTLPLSPPAAAKKSSTVVYFELDDNLDLNYEFANAASAAANGGEPTEDPLRDRNLTRYQVSSYSFSEKSRPSGNDEELELEAAAAAAAKKVLDDYKVSRRQGGRRRLQYKGKGPGKGKGRKH